MKLKEVSMISFFIHNNKVKFKWFEKNNVSICYDISFNLLELPIRNNLEHFDAKEMNNDGDVVLWNKSLELEYYSDQNKYWFLYDNKKQIFYNFDSLRQFSIFSNLFIELLPTNGKNNNFLYKGKVSFNVIKGKIDKKSIIRVSNNSYSTEVKKINSFIFKEISYEENLKKNKKIIINTKFTNNELFCYIKEIEEYFIDLDKHLIFDIRQILNIIKFCVLQSDFFNCLINIRSFKSLIYGYIFDNIFIPKYEEMERNFNKLSQYQNILVLTNNKQFLENEEHIKKYQGIISECEQNLIKLIKWYQQFDKKSRKLNTLKIYQNIMKEYESYYKIPIYYNKKNFNSLDLNKLKNYRINEEKILNYINCEIFNNEEKRKNFKKANALTNNSVHKNNYDKEGFEDWFLGVNEIHILKETLKIYVNIFKEAKNIILKD